MKKKYQRHFKNYLINPKFQLNFIGFNFIISFLVIGIFFISNMLFFRGLILRGQKLGLPSSHPYFRFIISAEDDLIRLFIISSIVVLIIISVGGIIYSHKIAGPLYKLKKHLLESNEGDGKYFSFRHGDFFQDLAQAYNQHLSKIYKSRGKK